MDTLEDYDAERNPNNAQSIATEKTDGRPATPMFFPSTLFVDDVPNSLDHPPQYKEQFTVTGLVRRVRLRKTADAVRTGVQTIANDRSLVIFRWDHAFFAFDASCPHQGADLSLGDLEDVVTETDGIRHKCVVCPRHKWRWRVDGANPGTPLHDVDFPKKLKSYPVCVKNNQLYVGFVDGFSPRLFNDDDF